ncbi:MAG: U32 family peptidase [Clostridia bacterium]|nr:U32 family peptidase [Clostridia bacterium]
MKTEILAPVGNGEMLIAAVRTGADAVYFGSDRFNARRNADNFSGETLKQAIEYAHLNNVKCYLTLNTVIKDSEINDALELVCEAVNASIDAIIVQDIGLARLIKKLFPTATLHASTQMSVHSPAALKILKKIGFSRVVPARELTKTELSDLCKTAKELDIEVEVFVHGALCMCLSGQCYFSAFLGGRSANRGLCAGTCRLPFSAKGGTGYDLSLKDLSLINYLNELTEKGVSSFKIEGRMKRPEYVASAVTAIRQMVDFGAVEPNILSLLEQIFSRDGFTDGYYTENFGKNMFGVRSEYDKQLTADALKKIHGLYRNELQKIPLSLTLTVQSGKPSTLLASADRAEVLVSGDLPEQAINAPLTYEKAETALKKLGGTCYFAENITANIEKGLMLPISALNRLRQNAVLLLNEKRIKNNGGLTPVKIENKASTNKKIGGFFIRFANLKQLEGCAEILPELHGFSLPAELYIKDKDDGILNKIKNLPNVYAELPRATPSDSYTSDILANIKQKGITNVICHNLSHIALASEQGFKIMGGFSLNLFNTNALETAEALKIFDAVLSPELSFSEISALGETNRLKTYSFCYGRQPLMITRNCPVKNGVGCKEKSNGRCTLTDRKKQSFPVICENGFSTVLNCKITDVSDSIFKINADFGFLHFTLEGPEEAFNVATSFLKGKHNNGADYTRGLFKSGVL